MKKVWIVQGTTGEYSDRTEWIARVFLSEERAEAFEHECLCWANRNGLVRRPGFVPKIPPGSPDPHITWVDYTGVDYCTVAAELDDTP